MVSPAHLHPSPNTASRNSGRMRGSLSNWRPPRTYNFGQQAAERELTQGRSEDLVANDWAANSGINAITTNAVGTGLKPQSHLNAKRLGITKKQAETLQGDIESVWNEWTLHAHTRGKLHFEDLQFLGLRTMLTHGEMLHLPVMMNDPLRPIKLAIQDIKPSRLCTPLDRQFTPYLVDGVQSNEYGAPEWYWIATPTPVAGQVFDLRNLPTSHFTRVKAHIGHRPGCFHLFRYNEDEQVRGHSVLSSGMNLFRHLSDALDNELLAQVVTASMAMFIAREKGSPLPDYLNDGDDGSEDKEPKRYYESVDGGTVYYGNMNEKPYVIENSRPSPNFAVFSEFVLRAMAASIDMPYEVLAKDFSKTNYSSARAALMEAWRIFTLYRSWLTRHYCQPVWNMVMEEAWLSGKLKFPAKAPDFYDAVPLYTKALWIGPPRGYIDPVKEITAIIQALDHNLMTYSEALAERGQDFDETMDVREAEEIRLAAMPKKTAPKTPVNPAATENEDEKEEADALA